VQRNRDISGRAMTVFIRNAANIASSSLKLNSYFKVFYTSAIHSLTHRKKERGLKRKILGRKK
jgi:hypothetical protein